MKRQKRREKESLMLGKVLGIVGAGVFAGGVVVELLRTGVRRRKRKEDSQEEQLKSKARERDENANK